MTTIPQTMRALYQTIYGAPTEVLQLRQTEVPTPKRDEVLLKVHATSPHAGDWHCIRGTPFMIRLFFGGLFRPKLHIPGTDASGVIVATGEDVRDHKVGDRVFGDLSSSQFGAFAEYATCKAAHIAKIPTSCSFREAASLGVSALAALQAVRDNARLSDGTHVLITGASGGVGSFAVQISRAYDARVTAVCRGKKMEKVKQLGAETVIDWEKDDVTKLDERYDAVIDCAMFRSPMDYVPVLKDGGRYVGVGGDENFLFKMMFGMGMVMNFKKRPASFLNSKPSGEDLTKIGQLVEEGKVVPLLDEERFKLEDIPRAVEKIEERNVIGKIVVDVIQE